MYQRQFIYVQRQDSGIDDWPKIVQAIFGALLLAMMLAIFVVNIYHATVDYYKDQAATKVKHKAKQPSNANAHMVTVPTQTKK